MTADNLINLLDALTETSIYVIEEDSHCLLYFNKRCQESGRPSPEIGSPCHQVWPEHCDNCPLTALGHGQSSHILSYDPLLQTTVDVTANRITWDGHIPAVVITVTPHRMSLKEEQGLQRFSRIYAQSLVTVFGECIIANLTADYYVNCQKDAMWTDIPEHGNFDTENRRYSRQVLHPDDLEQFEQYFTREAMLRIFGTGKKHITKRLRRLVKDGTYHMVEFTAARVEPRSEPGCWCVLVYRDMQDEYMLEQRRNVEISQLATAARTAYQMLIAVNLTRNTYDMLEYNRYPVSKPGESGYFTDLIAAEYETVHPDYQKEFISKFSRQALIDAHTGGQNIVSMKIPHKGTDGLYHWSHTEVVRVESPDTDDLIEITLSRSIDEDRRIQEAAIEKERQAKQLLEEALLKAENANQAKNDFLSKMSHDIRTPLNAIIGLTHLAHLHTGEEDRLKDYLEKISSAGTHLLSLINEVLDVSKIESGTMKLEETEFNLNQLLEDVVGMVRISLDQRRQSLSVHIEEGLHPQVIGDERRLKQILVNILDNASKYTPDYGKVSIGLNELNKMTQTMGAYRFTIEDTGIGMKPEYIKHIFEPFSRADDSRTSKTVGTGLGMTIVKNLVAMMGGDIQIESEYGKGTRFLITLTLNKCGAPPALPGKKDPLPETFPGLRILMAEDNEINRQIAVEMLGLLGAEVETAENGRAAVDAVLSHPPLYYDMVFMDIQMPVMNGYDAAQAIRSSHMDRIQELPIIAMTADAFAEDAKRARLSGMDGHLAKPVSMNQLKDALSSCLLWKKKNRSMEADGDGRQG